MTLKNRTHHMTLYSSGGGSEGLVEFLEGLNGLKILYIPLALDPHGAYFNTCENWINNEITSHSNKGPYEIFVVKRKSDFVKTHYDGVYISGGNTYRLLSLLEEYKLIDFLKELYHGGSSDFFGVSAGAIIFGSSIETSIEKGFNENRSSGLNLLGHCSIICHYQESFLSHVTSFVESRKSPVLALPEECTMKANKELFCILGNSTAHLFLPDGTRKKLSPGKNYSLP